MDLDAVADELYGLPPEEFTATRVEREKQAKGAGDAELAAAIHHLAKPNQVAWLANQLARERADAVEPLLELGAALREATASLSGDQLRELSKQQHQVIYALVQQAKQLARAAGKNVSEDTARGLESTFHAALADEDAAVRLIAGRLSTGLRQTGFGSGSAAATSPLGRGKHATPASTPAGDTTAAQRRAGQVDRARRDVEQAQLAERDAAAALDDAHGSLTVTEKRAAAAAADMERLREALNEATDAHSQAERDQRAARKAYERADRAARDARQRLVDATDRRDRLAEE